MTRRGHVAAGTVVPGVHQGWQEPRVTWMPYRQRCCRGPGTLSRGDGDVHLTGNPAERDWPCWGQVGTDPGQPDPSVPSPRSDDVLELSIMPKDEDILQLVSLPGGCQGPGWFQGSGSPGCAGIPAPPNLRGWSVPARAPASWVGVAKCPFLGDTWGQGPTSIPGGATGAEMEVPGGPGQEGWGTWPLFFWGDEHP